MALLSAIPVRVAAEEFEDAIYSYLCQFVESRNPHIGIVVGIVDEHRSRVVGYGKLDDASDLEVAGDTLFEIGSDTKTFTALLLQGMVERDLMKLDDPIANYLPETVKVPTRNGKNITLRHLATHTSGLPSVPDNLAPQRADNPYADYTVDKMYAFLSSYELPREPGAMSEYSNFGMGLLGHVIALKGGASYESLLVERICRPLQMDSTAITLTPEQQTRLATPHNQFGEPVPLWDISALPGAGALRSTANDLLKYISANLGLTPSNLTPLMAQTHEWGLAWYTNTDRNGTTIISHGGGTGGCRSFTGFDKVRRRGVVVLTNSKDVIDVGELANFLLNCEWQSDHRPTATMDSSTAYDAYVGHYQRVLSVASRLATLRKSIPRGATLSIAASGLIALGWWLRRASTFRKRAAILSFAVLMTGLMPVAGTLMTQEDAITRTDAGVGIFRVGNQLFAKVIGSRSWPMEVLLSPSAGELLPESDDRFFERVSGNPITFSRDALGNVTGLTAWNAANSFEFRRISVQPPSVPAPRNPRAAIKLDAKLLDKFVGQYEFAPNSVYPNGAKVRVWRKADQLLWQEVGENAIPGAIEIYAESQRCFFTKIDAVRIHFAMNANRDVTAVVLRLAGSPDLLGKKMPSPNGL
jgi:serine-type D-Ala-D-Ala carboxypeptidase/endopeptidase